MYNYNTGCHFIDGQWHKGKGKAFISYNPVSLEKIWQGNNAIQEEVDAAFDAASQAFPAWAILEVDARIPYLLRFAEIIEQQKQNFATLISQETGKPLWESLTEVASVIAKIAISIKAYQERNAILHINTPDAEASLYYKPQGVVAVLGPFNFPAHISNGHITPALLAGNTVIFKASELTPATGEFMMHCWQQAGLPKGVINCVQGDISVGQSLLAKDLKGVYFTGSYAGGKAIHKQFVDKPEVILALEMGGNNPLVVDEVKDIDAAVYQMVLSSFITAGQRCTCARRLIIKEGNVGDKLLARLIAVSKNLSVGPYTQNPEPFMGSIISHQHALKHLEAQENLLKEGGLALLSMILLKENTGLLSPGIIDMTKVKHPKDIEIFAPLVQIYRYTHLEEALNLANQTQYGLAAGLLSDDKDTFMRFYQGIKAGLINWNRPTTGASSHLPFGGVGHSGNHRPSAYFAADYCTYPVACLTSNTLVKPSSLLPGIHLE